MWLVDLRGDETDDLLHLVVGAPACIVQTGPAGNPREGGCEPPAFN